METLFGFDSSVYNGVFTVPELTNSGKSFWYFKGSGGDNGLYTDADFQANANNAITSGIKWGVYHFAGNTDPIAEANYAYKNVWSGLRVGALAILDIERGGNGTPDPTWTLNCLNHATVLLGFKPVVYMNQNTEHSYDWTDVVNAGYGLIIADYAVAPSGTVNLKYWKFYLGQQKGV